MKPPPRDVAELRSFMGMVNYMKRYSPVLTEMSAPLRELTKEGVLYRWELAHETAFQDIKQELTQTPVLAYFDARKRHVIQTDASQKGLGGVLLQDEDDKLKPVMYISRVLTPTEQGYSNLIYGDTVKVQTDQKPLENIYKKQVSETSPRLE